MKMLNIYFTGGEEDLLTFTTDEINHKIMIEIIEAFRKCLKNPNIYKGIEFCTNDGNYYILNHNLISVIEMKVNS